jgi:hypothetical protein
MNDSTFIILTCPQCQVKNRVKSYDASQVPVCAKCKSPLLTAEENEVHARFGQSVKDFNNLPGIGLRSDPEE